MTGLRRGEALGLQWKHIDLGRAALSVERSRVIVAYDVVACEPKTGKGRAVSLDGRTVETLKAWRDVQADELLALGVAQGLDSYIFTDAAGDPLHPDRVTKLFDIHQAAIRTAQKKADPKAETLPRIRSTTYGIRTRRICSRTASTRRSYRSGWATRPSPRRLTFTATFSRGCRRARRLS